MGMNVSRYKDTTELRFDVEFVTPCFLGGADGNAEIRTAPFKNLLRRWWRIANGNLSPDELWKKESRLFGSTKKDPDIVEENKKLPKDKQKPECFGKSKVELKIIQNHCQISEKKELRFPNLRLNHPEVSAPVSVESYLGMGPVFWNKELRRAEYKNSYIVPSEKLTMVLVVPKGEVKVFVKILSFIHYFGTIGSRSRNAWGSIVISNLKNITENKQINLILVSEDCLVDWNNIFQKNESRKYPYCFAKDEKGMLCWYTRPQETWEEAMRIIADTYLKIRTAFKFNKTREKVLEPRHLLGYPVTNHGVEKWDIAKLENGREKKLNTRLPSQLILKILKDKNSFYGIILHLPNQIPLQGFSIDTQKDIWKFVHGALDHYGMKRIVGATK